jgi:hypothetical protein
LRDQFYFKRSTRVCRHGGSLLDWVLERGICVGARQSYQAKS